MIRTQIQLTDEQAAAAKRMASERGVSMAEVIRDALDRELQTSDRKALWERALSVVGKFRDIDGATDVSERHDDYLAEIYEEDLR
jgi:hypothetical protein